MLPLLQLIQFICSSYHNGHVCICLPLPIAFLCCCCNLCPTLDHGTNKLRVEVTFFRPQFLRNFIRSLLCLTMHLFHAEFDFFSSNQGWCGIAIGPKQYVVVQCQHGSNIGFVEGLASQAITALCRQQLLRFGRSVSLSTEFPNHNILLAASFKKPTKASSSMTGLSARPADPPAVFPPRCPYALLPAWQQKMAVSIDGSFVIVNK